MSSDVFLRTLARILPGAMILLCGYLLMLAVALVLLTDGFDALRWLLSDWNKTARAFACLVVPGSFLIGIGWAGKTGIRWAMAKLNEIQRGQSRGIVDES